MCGAVSASSQRLLIDTLYHSVVQGKLTRQSMSAEHSVGVKVSKVQFLLNFTGDSGTLQWAFLDRKSVLSPGAANE